MLPCPARGARRRGWRCVLGSVRRVGVLANLDKPHAVSLTAQLLHWLAQRGVEAAVPPEVGAALGGGARVAPFGELAEGAAFLLVLGGDGTLLSAARRRLGIPLLGVNLGHLGFLTELEAPDLFPALPALLAGQYELDERLMLECVVHGPGGAAERYHALNDVVLTKGPFARLLRLTVTAEERLVLTYPGDGIIVSTPTGSTAYSLSAGGPVMHPHVQGLLVTPICPHSFYSRPVVLGTAERLAVRPEVAPGPRHLVDLALTVDAQEGRPLVPGEWLEVGVAAATTTLVRRPGWSFHDVLRRKLADDGRVAEGREDA